MPEKFWIGAVLLGGFLVYVLAKVISYMRTSEAQWRAVDKSKLKAWEDTEDD